MSNETEVRTLTQGSFPDTIGFSLRQALRTDFQEN